MKLEKSVRDPRSQLGNEQLKKSRLILENLHRPVRQKLLNSGRAWLRLRSKATEDRLSEPITAGAGSWRGMCLLPTAQQTNLWAGFRLISHELPNFYRRTDLQGPPDRFQIVWNSEQQGSSSSVASFCIFYRKETGIMSSLQPTYVKLTKSQGECSKIFTICSLL